MTEEREDNKEPENLVPTDNPPEVDRTSEWDSWFQGHLSATKAWRNAALFFAGLNLLVSGIAIYYASKPDRTPYVVSVDGIGQARLAGMAVEVGDWPDQVVKAELARFVQHFRSVPADPAALRGNYARMQSYLLRGSSAFTKVLQYGDDLRTNPFERVKTGTSSIQIVSVNQSEGSTYFVDWDEVQRNLAGEVMSQKRFRGSFVVSQAKSLPREQLLVNPLGLIIEDFDIQELRAF